MSMERAGYGLGGDFDFTTLFLDARNYIKLGPAQFLRYRLMAGSRTEGCLPLQKEFYVGGIGTLRGHDYKEMTGDQMMLGNIEYGAYAGRTVGLFLFVDSGKAWYGEGGFLDQRLELDAGVGIELLCQQTQLYAARDLKDSDSPILVGLRLNRTF
jgi:outer membrane protein assembly factor BamA